MSHLHRLDFKNLQLAGIRTPISRELRRQCLIPIKCDEELVEGDIRSSCSNTTRTMDEIKACHGLYPDDWSVAGQQKMGIVPLFKHIGGSIPDRPVKMSMENQKGDFTSFNVCISCHNRDRDRRRAQYHSDIFQFRSTMCWRHCVEYREQRPFNHCRCMMMVEKHWLCHLCSLTPLFELKLLAQGHWSVLFEENYKCHILGCTRTSWRSGPLETKMDLCRACSAIFPSTNERNRCDEI